MGDGNCSQQRDGVTFVSCMATTEKLNNLAMLTKGMTALQPVAPCRLAKSGQHLGFMLCGTQRNKA
jgi:hypothetical protein